jgi:hypothetical protein
VARVRNAHRAPGNPAKVFWSNAPTKTVTEWNVGCERCTQPTIFFLRYIRCHGFYLDPGGFGPRGSASPSLAGPRDSSSAPAGAPVARLARDAASSNEYNVLVSSRITG